MADFRKWFIVLAMLSVFAGMAAAQTTYGAFTCSTVAQVTPTLRGEGLTELVGDIVLTCTGGNPVLAGQPIPQANIIVSLTAPVTSRLNASNGASEALLLIDEPTAPIYAPVQGFGPGAQLNLCTSLTGGCVEYATAANATINGATVPVVVATDTAGAATAGKNVFQGVVAGSNQVIFPGVPILPPATAGLSRVYRITNIRVNANGAGNSLIGGIGLVQAYLSTSGPTSLPVGNQLLTVGFVQNSLTPTATSPSTLFTQCNSQTAQVATLNYKENFPSAFKTRVAPLTTTTGASYLATNSGTGGQNVPGQQYNTESGFILPIGSFTAGLADFGTRFKATFGNLPAGVSLYVSQYNLGSNGAPVSDPGAQSTNSYAIYTGTEAGAFPAAAVTPTSLTIGSTTVSAIKIVDTSTSTNTATAVWEVVNANLAASETFTFGVYISYKPGGTPSALTPSLTPTTNGPFVTQSYAPTPTAAQTVTWSAASATAPIPRFVVGANATTQPIITIVPCQTILLFPYVTTMSGLETGIAISNTALDPLNPTNPTLGSTGSCRLFFYGSNLSSTQILPPSDVTQIKTIGPIAPGNPDWTKAAFLASDKFGSNVTGYMFASCDFQYAHGFAFISDAGLRNLAMGYLALVVTDGNTIPRPGAQKGESLSN